MSDDFTPIKLKGKLMWTHLFVPDKEYNKYSATLLLDATSEKRAREENLRVKFKEEWKDMFEGYSGHFITPEKPVMNKAGNINQPPEVKDAKLRPVSPLTGIGHGTDAYVKFSKKTKDLNGKVMSPAEVMKKHGGYGCYLYGVQITNLVEYARSGNPDVDFVIEDGDSGFDFEKGDDPFDVI